MAYAVMPFIPVRSPASPTTSKMRQPSSSVAVAHKVMAYIVMANTVMALYRVMAPLVMANLDMAYTVRN